MNNFTASSALDAIARAMGMQPKPAEDIVAAVAAQAQVQVQAPLANESTDIAAELLAMTFRQAELVLTPLAEVAQEAAAEPTATGLVLDPSQQRALDGLVASRYGCLIGQAGTGKTTVTLRLVQELLRQEPDTRLYFLSFTGRAVQQLKRALPVEFHKRASTIHMRLEYSPDDVIVTDDQGRLVSRRRFVPHRTAAAPLPRGIYIIDEAGMLPIELWNRLWEAAAEHHARIYFIGDINQLKPAFGGSTLAWALRVWDSFALEEIHRQGADSPIITAADDVLNGRMPEPSTSPDGTSSIRVTYLNPHEVQAYAQLRSVVGALTQAGHLDGTQDMIICGTNKNPLGQESVNAFCAPHFNPDRPSDTDARVTVQTGLSSRRLKVGDRVMLLANDTKEGLTNGMLGTVVSLRKNGKCKLRNVASEVSLTPEQIEALLNEPLSPPAAIDSPLSAVEAESPYEAEASHIAEVEFIVESKDADGNPVETAKRQTFSTAGQFGSLGHGYACTCHKAQGGEFRNVVPVCHSAAGNLLTREWLYTAITRARFRVWLLGDQRGFRNALKRQALKGRTMLEKIEAFAADVQSGRATERPHVFADAWIEQGLLPEGWGLSQEELALQAMEEERRAYHDQSNAA